jgi:hypothetical protein
VAASPLCGGGGGGAPVAAVEEITSFNMEGFKGVQLVNLSSIVAG